MEREAFARAWRFLSFKPVAKWLAILCGIATAVLYVAFLALLALFADLLIYSGRIPAFAELTPHEQKLFKNTWSTPGPDQYLEEWSNLPTSKRQQRLRNLDPEEAKRLATADPTDLTAQEREVIWHSYLDPVLEERRRKLNDIGIEGKQADDLGAANADDLSPADLELLWRTRVFTILRQQVGADAAALIINKDTEDKDLDNRGILSLVVRSEGVAPGEARLHAPLAAWLARWMPGLKATDPAKATSANYLTGMLILALTLALLRALAMFLNSYLAALATIEASTRLRRAIYHHTFRLGTLAFRALGPGEAVGIFTRQVETVHNGLYAWLTFMCREPVKFVLLLAFALAVNFWLAVAFLIFALLVWLVGGQLATYFRRQERSATHAAGEDIALLQESLMMMRLVKCYLMELFNQSRVERQLAAHTRAQMSRYFGESVYRPLLITMGTLALLALLYVAGRIILTSGLGFGSLITLAAVLVSLYVPVVGWLEQRRLLRRAREAAVIVFKFLDRPGEVGQVVGAEFLPPMATAVEFDDVSLREPGTGRPLLQGVSLTIQANQRVALVGAEDVEKYALLYLIPRFLDPESGEIRIDEHNLRWVTLDSLRAQVGMVMQHNLVFNDTVANNIGCGDQGYDLPKIIEAAKITHAHKFVQKLPKGYETPIGEMGQHLNISEQFRIALARAIIRDPAVLIIEEPVQALDDDTKSLIDDTFARILPGRTVLFLPHRLSTLRHCDRVFLLHRGRIEAEGEHRELLAQHQLYRHLQYIEFNEFAEQV